MVASLPSSFGIEMLFRFWLIPYIVFQHEQLIHFKVIISKTLRSMMNLTATQLTIDATPLPDRRVSESQIHIRVQKKIEKWC